MLCRLYALAIAGAILPVITMAQQQDTTHHRPPPDTTGQGAARLKAVTITTTPVERAEPVTVTKVDQAQLSLSPATSPYELLQQTAGLEMHDQGQGPGFASDMSIRGFSSDHSTDIALWIDGVPINEPVNGHAEGYNDFNLIFPQVVTGIDVIHGPTSALYGNFAFGGAVNVRTLDKYDGYSVQMTGGSFGNGGGSAIVGFDNPGTGGVLAIQGTREDGWRTHSANQYGHLHARIEHDLNQSTKIDAGIEAYLTSYDSPGFLDTSLYNIHHYNFVSNFGDEGFKRRVQERVSLQKFLRNDLQWRTTVYSTQETWEFWLSTPPGLGGLTEGTGAETREYDGRVGFGGTTALTYAIPGVDITLGAETRYDWSHYQNWAEDSVGFHVDQTALILAEPARQTSGGIYFQGGFDVTKYARVDIGARVDQLSSSVRQPETNPANGDLEQDSLFDTQHSKGVFSPKAGLLVRPFTDLGASGLGFFVNASRGFRQTDGVISDPTLPFIFVWDYETGIRLDAGPVSADASLFRMDVTNEQSFDPVLNRTIGGGESRRNGLDLSATARILRGLTATTDFTILHAFYTHYIDPDDGINYTFYPIFNTSKYVGQVALDLNIPNQIWEGRVGTTFNGPYTPWEEQGVLRPGYALFNIEGGVRVYHDTHVLVGIRNLLDTRYRELESGGQVTPGQSQTIYATVRYDGLW
jgi:outer membrane receptor protein involved in Fe transport